jgi:hypothetical protein
MRFRNSVSVLALVSCVAGLAGCSGVGADESFESVSRSVESCVLGNPQIVEIREELPGPVAAGVTKIYHVTVRNMNSAACGPSTVSFTPDAFMFFSIVPQPSSIGGVAPGATASFRVEVTSDPSVAEGVYNLGFTLISNPGGSTRGSLTYEVDFDNPTGCNRQAPQFSVSPASPAPVPAGTAITYQVTIRNVDNRECGPDTFTLIFDFFRFFSIVSSGPVTIPAGGSGVVTVTVTSDPNMVGPGIRDIGFVVFGQRHGSLQNRGFLRYIVR